MNNVLITGITGFVGSRMALKLQSECNIVGIMRDYLEVKRLKLLGVDGVTLVKGDVADQELVSRAIIDYDIDTVFHFAAQSIVRRAVKAPPSVYMSNLMGTVIVLDACLRCGVDKVFLSSTDKVYGETLSATEESCLTPLGIYSTTKAAADLAAQNYINEFGLNVVIARTANIYGPGDTNPRIIPNTIRACLNGESPLIFTNVLGIREYVYVDDAVDAFRFLMKKVQAGGKIVNVGTGHIVKQEDVVKRVISHFQGIKPRYKVLKNTVKEIREQSLDSSRIKSLGWRPKVEFVEGIKRTVEWWQTVEKSGLLTSLDTVTLK